jgi:hypothetical protein
MRRRHRHILHYGQARSRKCRARRVADDATEEILEDWMAAPGDGSTFGGLIPYQMDFAEEQVSS